jgi:hypothetical protein
LGIFCVPRFLSDNFLFLSASDLASSTIVLAMVGGGMIRLAAVHRSPTPIYHSPGGLLHPKSMLRAEWDGCL